MDQQGVLLSLGEKLKQFIQQVNHLGGALSPVNYKGSYQG